jgi:O-acetyl-ADP-ribose deacetylase (regulator of RNase III)
MAIEVQIVDITKLAVDAIVNAANTTLLGGGGVDGAIHRAAGPELLEECHAIGGCPVGEARITRGYRLPARYVIHTVGPVWHGGKGEEPELLAACYRNSLQLAVENGINSIAFPAISCGANRYPVEQAAEIAVGEARHFLASGHGIERVIFACFGEEVSDRGGRRAGGDRRSEARQSLFGRNATEAASAYRRALDRSSTR